MPQTIQSDAFNHAALRSERYRIYGMFFVIIGFIFLNFGRAILADHSVRAMHRHTEYLLFWSICGAYELFMLWTSIRAQRAGRQVRQWLWVINAFVECSLPSIAILGQSADKSLLGPYLALNSGSLILYCCFIILSTLRLSPALCIFSGITCCAEYLGLYWFTVWAAPTNKNASVYHPETFIMNGVLLLAAGLLAAAVAWQIRKHVVAALQEAETRRKLDRIEHDLQTARAIQMGLLPKKSPDVPGYDIAGWSQPADQTGGDYYDWMELPTNTGTPAKILFTIADATGHGIGPALLIAACRAYFRAIASHQDPLEKITAQVDALLAADCPAGRFITAAIALLDPTTHQLSLYSAGHAPLYLYTRADDKIAQFDADQPPLGICFTNGSPSHARTFDLAPGDALILVTDGFFESSNLAGDLFGIDRLAATICSHISTPAAPLIQTLYKEVTSFSTGAAQADDITAVIIKRIT